MGRALQTLVEDVQPQELHLQGRRVIQAHKRTSFSPVFFLRRTSV